MFTGVAQAVGVTPAIVDLQVNPGEVVQRTVTVINTEDVTRTFFFQSGSFTPSDEPGVPVLDPASTKQEVASWISVSPPVVEVAPLGQVEVTVTVAVPTDAPRGDHYGTVLLTPQTTAQAVAQTTLLLFVTVPGASQYGMDVSAQLSSGLASALQNHLELRVQNAGNVYIKPEGEVRFDPLVGKTKILSANPSELRVLAQQTRSWTVFVGDLSQETGFLARVKQEWGNFALGPVQVHVELEAGGVRETAETSFFVFPWRTGMLLLLAGVLSWILFPKRRID